VCNEYSITVDGVTYGDWYLPSKSELSLLFSQKNVVRGFGNGDYWSSTEFDNATSWRHGFVNNNQRSSDKNVISYVRAVWAF
ncbi:MAG: hypothetical protein ACI9WO_002319, partial [Sphingobacteriales bacterium]